VSWDGGRPAPRPGDRGQAGVHLVEGQGEAPSEETPAQAGDQAVASGDASATTDPDESGGVGPAQEEGGPGDEQAIRSDLADLERIAAERDEYLDALRRLQADFENYKKRILKQQTEHLQRAAQDLVEKLLPALDAIDLARAHGAAGEATGGGFEQVANALCAVLQKEGLERIDPAGELFDPTEAEAVLHEAGEGGEPRVTEVMRAGYRWKGRVLRPAMVRVSG